MYECADSEMNPEDTWFKSDFYEKHFAENWYEMEYRTF